MPLTILKIGRFDPTKELIAGLKERGDLYFDVELSESERKEIRAKTDVVIASGGSVFTKEDLATTPNLKAIFCFSVGYDKIDVVSAKERGVIVTHTPDVLNDDVANSALMLTLNCTRQAYLAQQYVNEDKWGKEQLPPLTTSISHKRMGIAGLGRIGKEIAQRAQAFKMEIGYYGRHKQDIHYKYFGSLKELAKWCDILVLAMPASSENYHAVNGEILKALGANGFLINIARGSIVDSKDLIEALDKGVIAGAGLDVFEHEPKVEDALKNRANVALMPHLGSATNETRQAMTKLVLDNFDAFMAGGDVLTAVPGGLTHLA